MDIIWGTLAWLFWVGLMGFMFVLWFPMIVYWMDEGTIRNRGGDGSPENLIRIIIVGLVFGILATRLTFGGGLIDILAGR